MSVGGYYQNPHRSQYDGTEVRTRREGCVPATGANGGNASTHGRVNHTAEQVHHLIPKAEESDPKTPGWSLLDLKRAENEQGVPVSAGTGGWAQLIHELDAGHYVALQGDSDRFSNNTCSGDFDGTHCVGVHPARRVVGGLAQRWLDDPVCKGTGRWEYEHVLHDYAVKFNPGISYSFFTNPVPKEVVPPKPPTVHLYPGAVRLTPRQIKRVRVPKGRRANVRQKPTSASKLMYTKANGTTFTAYQHTTKGQLLAGSRHWYGDISGTKWMHTTSF